jgi:predicted MFS family arabinose efflux permease
MGVGLLLFAAGYALLVTMRDPAQWLLAQVFLGSGFAFSAILPVTVAVTLSVPQRTSLALGIAAAGASVGTLVLAPLFQLMIDAFGWRVTYRVVGTALVLVPVPFVLLCMPKGRLRREGDVGPEAGVVSLRDDLRRPEVLLLACIMLVPAMVSFGVHVHLVPLLTDAGHGPALSAAALGTAIGISAVGKVAGGLVGDRLGPLRAFRVAMLTEGAAVAALGAAASAPLVGLFVVAHGLALGTRVSVLPVIAMRILGTRRFGTRFGLLQLVITMGAAAAPLVPALIRDTTGSYRGAVGFWVGAVTLGVLLAFRLRLPGARPV